MDHCTTKLPIDGTILDGSHLPFVALEYLRVARVIKKLNFQILFNFNEFK